MSFENKSDDLHDFVDDEREPSWDEIMSQDHTVENETSLDATDYIALTLAALQTVFLPLVVLMIVMVVLGLYFTLFF